MSTEPDDDVHRLAFMAVILLAVFGVPIVAVLAIFHFDLTIGMGGLSGVDADSARIESLMESFVLYSVVATVAILALMRAYGFKDAGLAG